MKERILSAKTVGVQPGLASHVCWDQIGSVILLPIVPLFFRKADKHYIWTMYQKSLSIMVLWQLPTAAGTVCSCSCQCAGFVLWFKFVKNAFSQTGPPLGSFFYLVPLQVLSGPAAWIGLKQIHLQKWVIHIVPPNWSCWAPVLLKLENEMRSQDENSTNFCCKNRVLN
jgi:hypothetical protein